MIVPAGGAWLGPHPPKLMWRSTVAQLPTARFTMVALHWAKPH